jgi:DNA uptake protein ComE-like DNA-binding protein
MKGFVTGLGFGVIVGLLLAPKRGKLTRADVRDRTRRILRSLSDAIGRRTRERESLSGSKKSPSFATAPTTKGDREHAAEILNTSSRDALMAVHGIGQVLADRIIENRPYQKAHDVVEKGILPESAFVQLRRELLEKGA